MAASLAPDDRTLDLAVILRYLNAFFFDSSDLYAKPISLQLAFVCVTFLPGFRRCRLLNANYGPIQRARQGCEGRNEP
jgi:hypothetical protein